MTPTVLQAAPLLAFIRKPESRGNYNVVWGGIKPRHRPPKALTEMTIGEVLDWQDSIDHLYMSEAAGAYQMLEDTLRDIYAPAGLKLDDKFSIANQDRLAVHLLKQKGLTLFLRGGMDTKTFASRVARVWASLPSVTGPNPAASWYAGDGLNHALVKVPDYLKAVEAIKAEPKDHVDPSSPSVVARFMRFLSRFKHRKTN